MDESTAQTTRIVPRATAESQDTPHNQDLPYESGLPPPTSYPYDAPPQAQQQPQHQSHRPQLPHILNPTPAQLDSHGGITPAQSQQQPPVSQPGEQRPELPRDYSLAPKPKPGRKPATDVPADKRKASNREAQRKFRERRRKKLEEALEALDRERTDRIRREAEYAQQLEARDQIARYGYLPEHGYHRSLTGQQIIAPLVQPNKSGYKPPRIMPQRDVQDHLQGYRIPPPLEMPVRPTNSGDYGILTPASSKSSNASAISPGTILPLPKRESSTPEPYFRPSSQNGRSRGSMHGTHSPSRLRRTESSTVTTYSQSSSSHSSTNAMEVDFTNLGRGLSPPASPAMVNDDPCGFCVDGSYCPCKEDALNAQRAAAAAAAPKSRPRPMAMEPITSATGPGSCDACLNDPERRKMCIDIASRSSHIDRAMPMTSYNEVGTAASSPPSQSQMLPPINHLLSRASPEGDSYMTCNDAINLTRERLPHLARDPRSYAAFVSRLRTVTPARAACTTCPATDVHSHQDVEVASILEGMSRAGGGSGDAGAGSNIGTIESEGEVKEWGRERDSGYDSHRESGAGRRD